MHVRDVMSTNVITIDETASCHQAVEDMIRHKIRHLPVVGKDDRLRGIVTDRDLRHHLFRLSTFDAIGATQLERLLTASPVSRLMSAPVIVAHPDNALEDAARLMPEGKVGSLPVVEEEGHVVGIITETDLLRRIVGGEACCRDVDDIVVSFP